MLARVSVLLLLLLLVCSLALATAQPRPSMPPTPPHGRVLKRKIVNAEYIGYGTLPFPETVAFDNSGLLYVSLGDGSIRTVNGTSHDIEPWGYVVPDLSPDDRAMCGLPEYTQTCGRPLGLAFDSQYQWMYVADEVKGLLRIRTNNRSHVQYLANEHGGRPFFITNSVVVGDEGRYVYFTVSNEEYYFEDFMKMTLAARPTGRLLRFDLRTNQVTTLIDGIRIANGLTIAGQSPRRYLVVSVSSTGQLLRYWLNGRINQFEVLVNDLGGYPDNVSPDGSGGFYVSLLSDKSGAIDSVTQYEELKSLFLTDLVSPWIPLTWMNLYAHVQRYDKQGRLIEIIKDTTGNIAGPMSGVYVSNGFLYAGSFLMPVLTKIGLHNGDLQVVPNFD